MQLKLIVKVIFFELFLTSVMSRVSVINSNRVDFDKRIDWSLLGESARICFDHLGYNPTDDEILERCDGAEVLVSKEISLSEELVSRLPDTVKLICEAGTGYNNIALNACRKRGILVANVPSYSEGAVASLVITSILNFSCGFLQQQKELWQGDRSNFCKGLPAKTHFEVEGKTLGLIGGRGNIGNRVTATALSLGMKVLISTRSLTDVTEQYGVQYTDSVDTLLQSSDFVSIHCPLNVEVNDLKLD